MEFVVQEKLNLDSPGHNYRRPWMGFCVISNYLSYFRVF